MKVTFLLAAELDIQRAYNRYEGTQENRGDAFIAYFLSCARHPEHPPC